MSRTHHSLSSLPYPPSPPPSPSPPVQVKCNQYWPSYGSTTYGNVQVTLKEAENLAEYSIRTFSVSPVSGEGGESGEGRGGEEGEGKVHNCGYFHVTVI